MDVAIHMVCTIAFLWVCKLAICVQYGKRRGEKQKWRVIFKGLNIFCYSYKHGSRLASLWATLE